MLTFLVLLSATLIYLFGYFQTVTATGAVTLPPFEIRPAVFELDRGATVTLEALFAPGDVKRYTEQMTMVCDNCHVKHLTITGQFAIYNLRNSETAK